MWRNCLLGANMVNGAKVEKWKARKEWTGRLESGLQKQEGVIGKGVKSQVDLFPRALNVGMRFFNDVKPLKIFGQGNKLKSVF